MRLTREEQAVLRAYRKAKDKRLTMLVTPRGKAMKYYLYRVEDAATITDAKPLFANSTHSVVD